jgi:outer membrane lipoprotein-sorting protein
MNDMENKLSDYIDRLNKERKPDEHGSDSEYIEMEELYETVRLVRSLKEPTMPSHNYGENLAEILSVEKKKEKPLSIFKGKWFLGMVSSAAAVAIIVTLNSLAPLGNRNIVYAMEQAYKNVKAYHGVLEVIETNEEGKAAVQSKIEVWADKEGRYYVKGLEGAQKDLITVNDGQKKWQIQPQEKEVDIFAAFPDPYRFMLEIGKEIEGVKKAAISRVVGEDTVAGRAAEMLEVIPQGGSSYKIWIDKETKMPLQKQSAMEYSLQHTVRYETLDFLENVPEDILSYTVPNGFKETNTNAEQFVNSMEEAAGVAGFIPKLPVDVSAIFTSHKVSVNSREKITKISYLSGDNKRILVLQEKASGNLHPVSMAVLGTINKSPAEIQIPLQDEVGVLQGIGSNVGAADSVSIRWQQDGFEYAVVGNTPIEELANFVKSLANGSVELPDSREQNSDKAQVKVTADLEVEKGAQKNADSGHSPWKLDPAFVAQVFVSLKISPEGITGDYPIKYEEIKILINNGKEAVMEINGAKTPVKKVYLKRIVRQDNTGIWTVVGYDPAKN